MIRAFNITARALGLWWREFVVFIFFNLVWLALQLPIVTAPPATAAMYVIARRAANNELLDPRDGWAALRQVFVPAWKWGLVNLAIVIPLFANFYAYQNAQGFIWTVIRLVWGGVGVVWFTLNLFYWPFWLAQSDQRLVTTFRNSAVMLLKAPLLGLTLAVICGVLIAGSILFAVPAAIGLMAWLSLIGVLAVDEELERQK